MEADSERGFGLAKKLERLLMGISLLPMKFLQQHTLTMLMV